LVLFYSDVDLKTTMNIMLTNWLCSLTLKKILFEPITIQFCIVSQGFLNLLSNQFKTAKLTALA